MRIIAFKTKLILILHAVRPHPPPLRHEFPQLPWRADRRRRGTGRAGGPQRRRQDQSDRGDLVSRARTRPAAGNTRRLRLFRRRGIMGGSGGLGAWAWSPTLVRRERS